MQQYTSQNTKGMFTVYFLLLPFIGYKAVLGMQWLGKLGPIICDFQNLTLQIQCDKESICLQVLKPPKSNLSYMEYKEGMKMETQLYNLQMTTDNPAPPTPIQPQIKQVLVEFPEVFMELKELPLLGE